MSDAIKEIERTSHILLEVALTSTPRATLQEILVNCATRLQKTNEQLLRIVKERNDLYIKVQILEQQLRGFQQEGVKSK